MATSEGSWVAHPYLVQEGMRRYCERVRLGIGTAKAGDTVIDDYHPQRWGPETVQRVFMAGHNAYLEMESGLVVLARGASKVPKEKGGEHRGNR